MQEPTGNRLDGLLRTQLPCFSQFAAPTTGKVEDRVLPAALVPHVLKTDCRQVLKPTKVEPILGGVVCETMDVSS